MKNYLTTTSSYTVAAILLAAIAMKLAGMSLSQPIALALHATAYAYARLEGIR